MSETNNNVQKQKPENFQVGGLGGIFLPGRHKA